MDHVLDISLSDHDHRTLTHTYQPSRDHWIIQAFDHESRDLLTKYRDYELFCITNVHVRSLNLDYFHAQICRKYTFI